ncbi:MAG: hypothetical protein ABEI27_01520 [Halobellus sp.]|uniref:hypothetical protein n=1 Tax=Halobellus sp. TaxID=1979212 RepID=UPI0035D4197A
MSTKRSPGSTRILAGTLLRSLVVLLTVPTGVGPIAGGWIASRGIRRQARAVVAAAVAGLLGVSLWTVTVWLAVRGAIDPAGYHEGIVHIGIRTASPGRFVRWQEIGVTLVPTVTVAALSVAGGILAALSDSHPRTRRGDG